MIQKLKPELRSGLRLLERAHESLTRNGSVSEGMELLMSGLRSRRKRWKPEPWRHFCEQMCLSHPLKQLLHQDPMTYRAFSKPRGYPGDAVLLDFLYREPSVQHHIETATPLGRAIYEFQAACPCAESVRWRREFLARTLDETASRVANPEVLSLACGHLREAADSLAVRNNLIKRFVAFDQDERSLRLIQSEKNGANIECVRGGIKEFITGKTKLGEFDLIYSAGLYDYLSDAAARLLTRGLFSLLKPKGRLLIANFLPGNIECGYMEAFMGWKLLYRTRAQFERVTGPLRKHIQKIFFDDNRYVLYLELRKD